MMLAPQVLITEQQFKDIQISSKEKSKRHWRTLKSVLMATEMGKTSKDGKQDNDDRYFIPSPISTSTDAFRFSIDLTPNPPPLPTDGEAWNHTHIPE